jgi:hypothetical protein
MTSPGSPSPFRSELESLQEQLRRAEEKTRDAESKADVLEREKKWLQKEIARGRRPVTWTAGGIVALAVIGVGAIFVGSRVEVSKARAVSDAMEARCDAQERADRDLREQLSTDLETCRKDLATSKGETYNPTVVTLPPCNCQPGDPLCACLDAPFNRGAAAAVLGRADHTLIECIKPSRTTSFHMTVTFAPTGRVSSAVVDADSTKPNPLTASEKECLGDRLKATASVPAFSGAPIRVGKSYSVGGSN